MTSFFQIPGGGASAPPCAPPAGAHEDNSPNAHALARALLYSELTNRKSRTYCTYCKLLTRANLMLKHTDLDEPIAVAEGNA